MKMAFMLAAFAWLGCAVDSSTCTEGEQPPAEPVPPGMCVRATAYAPDEAAGVPLPGGGCDLDTSACAIGMPGQPMNGPDVEGQRFALTYAELDDSGACPLECE